MPSADAQEGTTQPATIPRDRRQAPTPRSPSETPPGPPEATPARRTTRAQETTKSTDAVRGRRRPLTASFIIPLPYHAGRQKTAQRPHISRERAFQAMGHTEAPTQTRGPAAVRRGDDTTPSPGSMRPARRGTAARRAGGRSHQQHPRRTTGAPAKLDPRRTRPPAPRPPRRAPAPAPMEPAQADPVKRVFFARRHRRPAKAARAPRAPRPPTDPARKLAAKQKPRHTFVTGRSRPEGRGRREFFGDQARKHPFCAFLRFLKNGSIFTFLRLLRMSSPPSCRPRYTASQCPRQTCPVLRCSAEQ